MKIEKNFPNGFTSWIETHHEVVKLITLEMEKDFDEVCLLVKNRYEKQGYGALYEIAEELTDEFELNAQNEVCDGTFFEDIEEFINNKFYGY